MTQDNGGSFSWGGLLQTVATTATGYLDKRLDMELQTKLARLQNPQVVSNQAPVQNVVPTQAGMFASMGPMMPLLLVAGLAVLLLRK